MKINRLLQQVAACVVVAVAAIMAPFCWGQESADSLAAPGQLSPATEPAHATPGKTAPQNGRIFESDYDYTLGKHVFKDFAEDQETIWTSPLHLHVADGDWLVPLGGVAAAMFATDTEVSRHLSNSPNRLSESKSLSDAGLAAFAGIGGGLFLWGHISHDDHKIETGFLAGEAAIDSLADTYALKYALGRERPLQDNYQGSFWKSGDSFPSEHSSASWAIASVIAHEYPGPLTSVLAYGMASAVSASRLSAKQHFPSDVLIGSALGWFVGQEVYRHRHNPENGGGEWETYAESHDTGPNRPSNNVGSPYVEIDSWMYPALERLAQMGYIDDAFLSLRPWTRGECLRLLQEAEDHSATTDHPSDVADDLIDALEKDLEPTEPGQLQTVNWNLDSVYTRYTNISGEPLTDGYHFAQTLINDYGRPSAEGNNVIAGTDGWFNAGSMIGYARVEYQYAPAAPALPPAAREAARLVDFTADSPLGYPLPPVEISPNNIPPVSRVDLLEGYAGFQFRNWQVTFGKQSEWWGPDRGGPMMFSNNAEPIMMFRVDRTVPFHLPSILGLLGPIRVEFLVGQLSGEYFNFTVQRGYIGSPFAPLNDQPLINGQAFSFKPTKNVEFAFTRTTIFSGVAVPFTPRKLIQSIFSLGNGPPGANDDPGDRRSGFSLDYRLPFVRNWVSFYADGFAEDQITPVAYWDRSAWISGLYFSHVPFIPKLDLRVEGSYTDLPIGGAVGPGFFYNNSHYLSGYTNAQMLIGSWIGRGGQGSQAWATYSFTPRNKLQFEFRHQKVSKQFIPNGGTLTDGSVTADLLVRKHMGLSAFVQYERWNFPVIAPVQKTDITTSLQLKFWPSFNKKS